MPGGSNRRHRSFLFSFYKSRQVICVQVTCFQPKQQLAGLLVRDNGAFDNFGGAFKVLPDPHQPSEIAFHCLAGTPTKKLTVLFQRRLGATMAAMAGTGQVPRSYPVRPWPLGGKSTMNERKLPQTTGLRLALHQKCASPRAVFS